MGVPRLFIEIMLLTIMALASSLAVVSGLVAAGRSLWDDEIWAMGLVGFVGFISYTICVGMIVSVLVS